MNTKAQLKTTILKTTITVPPITKKQAKLINAKRPLIKQSLLAVLLGAMMALPMPSSAGQGNEGSNLAQLFAPKAQFLPVTQAFNVSANQQGQTLSITFRVTPAHYVYQDKLKLNLPAGVSQSPWQFNKKPTMIDDPEFGRVAVFESDVVATTTLTANQAINDNIKLTWQGCAKAGLCYPPEVLNIPIALSAKQGGDTQTSDKKQDDKTASNTTTASAKSQTDLSSPTSKATNTTPNQGDSQSIDGQALTQPSNQADGLLVDGDEPAIDGIDNTANDGATPPLTANLTTDNLSHQTADSQDSFGLITNPVLAVFLLFLAGIALAFTACVYPMIPIVANIVARSNSPSAWRGFVLTLAYGLGVATSYGILGALVAWFGRSLGIIGWLQNPWILLGFAGVFVLLSLQMMGLIRLGLPSAIKDKLTKRSQAADRYLGSTGGSFLVGALSALVVSPCVSAPLAGALAAVSVSGNVVLGFVALFALGFGVSLPLVVMGAAQGKFMPKAGAWMDLVKYFGGLMLLLVAVLLVSRVFLSPAMLVLWAFWFMLMGLFLWSLQWLVFRSLGLLSGLWAVCLMFGAALGQTDSLQPLKSLGSVQMTAQITKADLKATTLAELDAILMNNDQVLIDLTADWCIECRIMEKTLFTNRPAQLADWQVVKLDISETNDDSRAILARYELFGPPALLYYKNGNLVQKQLGEVSRSDFEQALSSL